MTIRTGSTAPTLPSEVDSFFLVSMETPSFMYLEHQMELGFKEMYQQKSEKPHVLFMFFSRENSGSPPKIPTINIPGWSWI